MTVPLSFGLIMAGFAGHAVFPTVYRDMENPKQYRTMVNWTYVATTIVYFGVAACGYLMFGSQTMQEVRNTHSDTSRHIKHVYRLRKTLCPYQSTIKHSIDLLFG